MPLLAIDRPLAVVLFLPAQWVIARGGTGVGLGLGDGETVGDGDGESLGVGLGLALGLGAEVTSAVRLASGVADGAGATGELPQPARITASMTAAATGSRLRPDRRDPRSLILPPIWPCRTIELIGSNGRRASRPDPWANRPG